MATFRCVPVGCATGLGDGDRMRGLIATKPIFLRNDLSEEEEEGVAGAEFKTTECIGVVCFLDNVFEFVGILEPLEALLRGLRAVGGILGMGISDLETVAAADANKGLGAILNKGIFVVEGGNDDELTASRESSVEVEGLGAMGRRALPRVPVLPLATASKSTGSYLAAAGLSGMGEVDFKELVYADVLTFFEAGSHSPEDTAGPIFDAFFKEAEVAVG